MCTTPPIRSFRSRLGPGAAPRAVPRTEPARGQRPLADIGSVTGVRQQRALATKDDPLATFGPCSRVRARVSGGAEALLVVPAEHTSGGQCSVEDVGLARSEACFV